MKRSKFGLYDFLGNVWELCNDWGWGRSIRNGDSVLGAPTGTKKIEKGASYVDVPAKLMITTRQGIAPNQKYTSTGLRLAIQPPFVPPKAAADAAQSPDANLAKAKREMEEKIAAQHEEKAKQKK